MKAIVFERQGGPEVLQFVDYPDPVIGPTQILVRVHACALNHLDIWVRSGLPGIPLPHIPGSDISGEVEKIGVAVTNVRRGDKVLLQPGVSCGKCPKCLEGDDNQCRQYTLLGQGVDGGCAQFVAAPSANAVPIPDGIRFEEAAAFPLVFLTAWHMLFTRAKLQPAESVLILGAGSGVGSAAIQLAKTAGARVIATAGSEAKLAKAREIGADEIINHSQQRISEEVRRITKGAGVDVVFEHVGQATWEESLRSMSVGGRLVTCGATTGFEGRIDIRHLFVKQLSILGSFMGGKGELFPPLALFARGLVKPVIDVVMPLEKCADAHRRLENREQFGKIVLKVE